MSERKQNRIAVTLPRAYAGEEQTAFVSINGKNYLLPRGKTLEVPPEVAFELERAERARLRLDEVSDRLMKENL